MVISGKNIPVATSITQRANKTVFEILEETAEVVGSLFFIDVAFVHIDLAFVHIFRVIA